jgi:putative nucleotidyltransferase with HDIG domain
MSLSDREEILGCLCSNIQRHFPIDVVGFLGVQKRYHEFFYWSPFSLSDDDTDWVCRYLIDHYNMQTESGVTRKRAGYRRIGAPPMRHRLPMPLVFGHFARLDIEGAGYGALYFGSHEDMSRSPERLALLSSIIHQTRNALTNSKLYSDMKENYIRTIKALAIAVDAKDTYTHGHSENVMSIAEAIANEIGLDPRLIGTIRDGGLLHDIGKIGIPGYILNKPGTLTSEEFNGVMKTHTTLGANIVKDVPFLRDLYQLILHHHENFDGSGYPDGLKGQEIPIGARILHVADAFEAMTSNRPYRKSLGKEESLQRLKRESGRQFDPKIVDAFLKVAARKGWWERGT